MGWAVSLAQKIGNLGAFQPLRFRVRVSKKQHGTRQRLNVKEGSQNGFWHISKKNSQFVFISIDLLFRKVCRSDLAGLCVDSTLSTGKNCDEPTEQCVFQYICEVFTYLTFKERRLVGHRADPAEKGISRKKPFLFILLDVHNAINSQLLRRKGT